MEVGDVAVVRFRNRRITEDVDIQEVGNELYSLVESDEREKLLLNFSMVEFFSSAAIGKLITLHRKMKAQGGVLKLSNIRPDIREVFTIFKLDRLFDIKDDEADALAAF
jgi:anti-sigma B factor antagonist